MNMLLILSQIQTTPVTAASTIDFTWLFIKMLLALGIVSGVAVLVLKYVVPRASFVKSMEQGGFFKIISRYAIGTNKILCLVQAGKRYLVLGVSDHAINVLLELPENEAVIKNHENQK